MKKVIVIGAGGSGKTTLAKAIGARTGLPVIHLDQLYWGAGWRPTPNDEWDRVVAELTAREVWVIDGNYGRTLSPRLDAADTVVFLDLSRRLCLWRVFKRQLRWLGRTRPELPAGCPERLTFEFVSWIWTYRARRRPEVLRRLAAVTGPKRVIILRRARDVRAFVATLPDASAQA